MANPSAANSADLRLHVAGIYRDVLKKPREAIQGYEEILRRYPKFDKKLELKLQLAEIHRRQRTGLAKARNIYMEIAREFPKRPEARRALLEAAWLSEEGGLRDYAGAVQAYNKYVKQYPKAADVCHTYWRMGALFRDKLGQPTNTVDWFERAYKLRPNAALLWEKALALSKSGQREAVVKTYRELIQKYPESAQAIEAYNRLWREQKEWGNLKDAARVLQEAVAKYPRRLSFLYALGQLYSEMKQWDQAIAAFAKVA